MLGLSENALLILLIGLIVSLVELLVNDGGGMGVIVGTIWAVVYDFLNKDKPPKYLLHKFSVAENPTLKKIIPGWHRYFSFAWTKNGLPPSPKHKKRYEP